MSSASGAEAKGMKQYRDKDGNFATKLYDEKDLMNPEKANYYIYNAYLGKNDLPIQDILAKHIQTVDLTDLMNFGRVEFIKNISTRMFKKKAKIESRWELVKLEEVTEIFNGGTPDTNNGDYWDGGICWATLADTKEKYLYQTQRTISELGLKNSNAQLLPINTVLFSSRATIGDVTIAKVETSTNQGYKNFVCNPARIYYEYLYYILKHVSPNIKNLASGMTYPEISKELISNFKIPLPPLDVQEKIVKEMGVLEGNERELNTKISSANNHISQIIKKVKDTNQEIRRFDSVASLEYGSGLPERERISGEYPVMGSNGIVGYHNQYLIKSPSIIVGRKGSAGKVTLVEKNTYPIDTAYYLKYNETMIHYKYLYYVLKDMELYKLSEGIGVPGLNRDKVHSQSIILPPLEKQKEIVEEIEKIESELKILEARLEQLNLEKEAVIKKYL